MKIIILIAVGFLLILVDYKMNTNQNYNYKNNNEVNKISGLKYRKEIIDYFFACLRTN